MNNELIKSPTLLLDERKCRNNIKKMVTKTAKHNLAFRPHFKTHQSGIIGNWIKNEGVNRCTVSSLKMAEYFAGQGWNDVLIAFPVNVLEHQKINQLASKISLQILVYDAASIKILGEKIDADIGVKIELDLGSKRSGLLPGQHKEIDALISRITDHQHLKFTGFYSHPGHTYTARGENEVKSIYKDFLQDLSLLEQKYGDVPGFSITIGDTPGCTLVEDFGPIKEISPGNFVFYDVMQVNIGSCDYDDIAVVMACPVVGKNAQRNEILIHGGAVHFSKEVLTDPDGTIHFGKLAKSTTDGWEGVIPGCYLKSISQEHGLVHATDELLDKARIGDIVYIYPVHSCLSADLMKSYLTTGKIELSGDDSFLKY
jgi:D-serine deaminase-like pyridoxal phosphate-dependent protein